MSTTIARSLLTAAGALLPSPAREAAQAGVAGAALADRYAPGLRESIPRHLKATLSQLCAVSPVRSLPFASADEAALAALQACGQQTRDEHMEHGGWIYRDRDPATGNVAFYYTQARETKLPPPDQTIWERANIGPNVDGDAARLAREHPNAEIVAHYHAHPYFKTSPTNETFSYEDTAMYAARSDDGYLLTVSGQVLKWDIRKRNEDNSYTGERIGQIPLTGTPRTDVSPRNYAKGGVWNGRQP